MQPFLGHGDSNDEDEVFITSSDSTDRFNQTNVHGATLTAPEGSDVSKCLPQKEGVDSRWRCVNGLRSSGGCG